jgi:hypothetical protein
MANVFYNRIIRKLVVGFGNLFNNITLVRYNPDLTEQERIIIPIAYATKELYVKRLDEDYNLDKKVQTTLPRFSFEMTGFSYDATRKQNTNVKTFAKSTSGGIVSQYNPVPYNFDFSLYLYVRNTEDAVQVLEHIMSYFTPDYTIKLNLVPEMGIIKEIPVVLNNTSQEIQYEGTRDSETRLIIWTLNFTVKGFIYGGVTNAGGIIKTSIVSILDKITPESRVAFNIDGTTGIGNYQTGETVYQGYSPQTYTAMGVVNSWSNNTHKLVLTNVNGSFNSDMPIYGMITNSNYKFTSYDTHEFKYAEVHVTTNPANANVNTAYTYTTTITENN